MHDWIRAWPGAFSVTLLVEALVLFVLLRHRLSATRIGLLAVGLNLITHPVVWFVFPKIITGLTAYLVLAEAFALTVEATLLTVFVGCPIPKAIMVSAAINASSYLAGLVVVACDT